MLNFLQLLFYVITSAIIIFITVNYENSTQPAPSQNPAIFYFWNYDILFTSYNILFTS